MATAKKVTKKSPAKKAPLKRSAAKRSKKVVLESFKLCRESAPFVSLKITDQTVYWSILLVMVLVLALWVLQIQIDISNILNSINATI